jgi:Ca2+-transporting ATPase
LTVSSAAAPAPQVSGLSESEAARRLRAEGFNELPKEDTRTPLRIALEAVREPMLALLLGGGLIYLALGDIREALLLLAFAMMSVVITVVQEARTERVLEALRDLSSPRALVIREGQRRRIPGREVVRGDIIVVSEGDRVPADGRLVQCSDLHVDESLLTGESVPVRKIAAPAASGSEKTRPGGDDLPYVFSGSLAVRGQGTAEVTAIGIRSELGLIGQALRRATGEPPRLRAQMRRLVRLYAIAGAMISLAAVLLHGFLRAGWLEALLAGIALGMSMVPEEFPVVLTVFLAMGAWRISKARVLTRRASAIETLGSATVLCTDKTGTLTENRMSIAELRLPDGETFQSREALPSSLSDGLRNLVRIGVLASAPEPVDPMERAFHEFAQRHSARREPTTGGEWTLARTYGLSPGLLAMSNAWRPGNDREGFVVAAKGAPEAIATLCGLGDQDRAALGRAADEMAGQGMRLLGIACASHDGKTLPESQQQFDFRFLGLVGLADPIRLGVREAISQCKGAGIRVVIITGDYPITAKAIAAQAGLDPGTVVTGEDLRTMNAAELADHVREATVFARVMPEQKLRIIEALKANGEIVAMTGDGVNDAPSLKTAHIGIAMGGRGTDVAREASSLVLLDDDFGSIVGAIRLGRRIYDNLRKAMAFIFAVHIPIAGLALLPLLTGTPLLLWPVHIAFLEMVIDPVCSLVFESETEEDDVMSRPPRPPEAPLFSGSLIGWSLLQGFIAFFLVAAILGISLQRAMPETELRALVFFSLVVTLISLIFVNRSFSASVITALRRPNTALSWVLAAVAAILSLSLLVPMIKDLFRFGRLHPDDLALTAAAGLAALALLEMLKPLWSKRFLR